MGELSQFPSFQCITPRGTLKVDLADLQQCAKSEERDLLQWTDSIIGEGLGDLELYETGHENLLPSLQSCLWRIFCSKSECEAVDSWAAAIELVSNVIHES